MKKNVLYLSLFDITRKLCSESNFTGSGNDEDKKNSSEAKEKESIDTNFSVHSVNRFAGVDKMIDVQENKTKPISKSVMEKYGGSCEGCHAASVTGTKTQAEKEDSKPPHSHSHNSGAKSDDYFNKYTTHKGSTPDATLAEEELFRFLTTNTIRSIKSSDSRSKMEEDHRPRRRGTQALLDYNKQWAAEVSHYNPNYFSELAKQQKPEFLWIGCSDSRVPANEIVGLHPGDVFVHRNIANIVSLTDLNCLSALQFAVDCLKVQHIIVAGHYKCGGVTAAMLNKPLGLTEHWIMQVTETRNRHWHRMEREIHEEDRINLLCELNVLDQLSHVCNCRIVQRKWNQFNNKYHSRIMQYSPQHIVVRDEDVPTEEDADADGTGASGVSHEGDGHGLLSSVPADSPYGMMLRGQRLLEEEELECHGWVYSLDDGMLRPLLTLTRLSNVKKQIEDATEAVFVRYSLLR